MLRAFDGEYMELAMRFDGFDVAHRHIPVTEILASGPVCAFVSFLDGMSGMTKTADFRVITTGNLSCQFPTARPQIDKL
jgi:hypothetical protein